ncbi:HK97-gp10 family putative phage morphogenesis protein [Acinetobacter baumannii]|uniref:HK97 gp10 family phage protein n=1 Tax=Acinetobacter baumannii TaxID=470 RepID=A0A6I4HLD5_ACIBA|nr:HK97-gp10 family putative phage morphogenesis protein [Acinetobacter baumannii]EHZ7970291.1 HK97 gp10 family phage protein [Acinetobacter baumannii]EKU4294702.1 HK97 gp10 family phage protein [Acinetobacter baumannii]EKU4350640.1 HK97 gp10 family phage protein [Acinetobacter baumannii]EKU7976753.1 HK97 gp10 family phage protein [Acinetobacter baumannii]EKV6376689.1 HK97 gp10 family phage protein [Acinetobacter baumannii]
MTTQIHGLEPALRRMRAIGNDKTVKRIARKAMRQAMNIARDEARQKVKRLDDPTTPEKIWKEIVVQNGRSRNKNTLVMRVGVRGGARIPYTNNAQNRRSGRVGKTYQTDGRVFYWRFLELGTSRQPATPFLRPALYENIEQITDKFVQVFNFELSVVLGAA